MRREDEGEENSAHTVPTSLLAGRERNTHTNLTTHKEKIMNQTTIDTRMELSRRGPRGSRVVKQDEGCSVRRTAVIILPYRNNRGPTPGLPVHERTHLPHIYTPYISIYKILPSPLPWRTLTISTLHTAVRVPGFRCRDLSTPDVTIREIFMYLSQYKFFIIPHPSPPSSESHDSEPGVTSGFGVWLVS